MFFAKVVVTSKLVKLSTNHKQDFFSSFMLTLGKRAEVYLETCKLKGVIQSVVVWFCSDDFFFF